MGDARETEKDPDAFRTISEVAEDLNLPQHVLRFWETRFPQIKPVKRAGGRRFYRPEDVDLLRGIRQLLYREGYTIKGVQKILKEQGIRHVQDIGVERDVAVMRTAPPDRAPPPGGQEGVTFGGLLGLLPRRRGKAGEGPAADDLPRDVELPLPFPDPEADRDLADQGEPLAPLPPRVQARERRLEERRLDDSGYEERIYQERSFAPEPGERREPRLGPARPSLDPHFADRQAPVEAPSEDEDDPFFDDEPAAPPSRRPPASPPERASRPVPSPEPRSRDEGRHSSGAPSFAPPRAERAEPLPQRRPTRGPAARVSTALLPEGDDPLLPFLTDEPARREDPLEERIRRLKAQEAGPPEEYLPPKFRRRATDPGAEGLRSDAPRPELRAAAPPRAEPRMHPKVEAPRGIGAAPQAPTGAWPELARAAAAAERDLAAWHEQIRPHEPSEPEAADWDEDEQDEPAPLTSARPHLQDDAWDDDGFEDEAADLSAGSDAHEPLPSDAEPVYDEDEAYDGPPAPAAHWQAPAADDSALEEDEHDAPWRSETWQGEAWHGEAWQGETEQADAPQPAAVRNDAWASGSWGDSSWHEEAPRQPPAAPHAQNRGSRVGAPLSARLGMQLAGSGPVRPVRIPRAIDYEAGMFTAPRQTAPQAAHPPQPRATLGTAVPPAPAPNATPGYPVSSSQQAPLYGGPYGAPPSPQPWGEGAGPEPRFGMFTTPLDEAAILAQRQGAYGRAAAPVYGAPAPVVYGQRLPGASGAGVAMAPLGGVPSQGAYPPSPYGADYPADYPADYQADPWGRPLAAEPAPTVPPQGAGRGPAEAQGAAPVPPPFWQGRDPFETPAPVPIEPYLPPHLRAQPPVAPSAPSYPSPVTPAAKGEGAPRNEARSTVSGTVHAVLSREDVNRLQAALYELGECRRLLRDLGGAKPN